MAQPSRFAVPPVPAVVLSVCSFVAGAVIAKGLFPVLGASGTVGLRIGLSALMLSLAFRPRLGLLGPAQWKAIVPYGMVLGLMNFCFYLAIERIPLGLGVTLEFVGPLSIAVLGSRRALDVVWVVLAGTGIAMIAPWNGHGIDPVGVGFALLAGVCWASYIVLGKRASRALDNGAAVSIGMLIATLTVVPFAAAAGSFAHVTPRLFAAGAGVALLSSAIPYFLEMIALRAMPARTFGILMSLEPAVAAMSGLAFLGEHLTTSQCLAIAFVITASVGATVSAREVTVPVEV